MLYGAESRVDWSREQSRLAEIKLYARPEPTSVVGVKMDAEVSTACIAKPSSSRQIAAKR